MSAVTKEKLVEELDLCFLKIALDDIKRASDIDVNTTLAPFILGSCFVEALAGFYCGQEDPDAQGNGERFVKFVTKYLPQYNATNLWKSLRNGLVHSYAEKGKYSFTNKKSRLHFQTDPIGRKIINDENFVNDLETAYENFKKDILDQRDDGIFLKAKKRFDSFGLMKIVELKYRTPERET